MRIPLVMLKRQVPASNHEGHKDHKGKTGMEERSNSGVRCDRPAGWSAPSKQQNPRGATAMPQPGLIVTAIFLTALGQIATSQVAGQVVRVVECTPAGGHVVGGFASRDDRGVVRVLLYAFNTWDTQSLSGATFEVALNLAGAGWNGSGFGAGVSLRPRPQLALPADAGADATDRPRPVPPTSLDRRRCCGAWSPQTRRPSGRRSRSLRNLAPRCFRQPHQP